MSHSFIVKEGIILTVSKRKDSEIKKEERERGSGKRATPRNNGSFVRQTA